jgi:hypothetical protein
MANRLLQEQHQHQHQDLGYADSGLAPYELEGQELACSAPDGEYYGLLPELELDYCGSPASCGSYLPLRQRPGACSSSAAAGGLAAEASADDDDDVGVFWGDLAAELAQREQLLRQRLEEERDLEEEEQCGICLEARNRVALAPCRHQLCGERLLPAPPATCCPDA